MKTLLITIAIMLTAGTVHGQDWPFYPNDWRARRAAQMAKIKKEHDAIMAKLSPEVREIVTRPTSAWYDGSALDDLLKTFDKQILIP